MRKTNLKATCDSCRRVFVVKPKKRVVNILDGTIQTYFVCPFCKKEYSCGYVNSTMKKMQKIGAGLSEIQKYASDLKKMYDKH